jgi:hypothetical protein
VAAILHIGIAEPEPEAGLLEQGDIDEVRREKDESPYEMGPGKKNEGLPEEHKHDAGYHWIADVAIGSANDETARRIPRGEGAFSLRYELS